MDFLLQLLLTRKDTKRFSLYLLANSRFIFAHWRPHEIRILMPLQSQAYRTVNRFCCRLSAMSRKASEKDSPMAPIDGIPLGGTSWGRVSVKGGNGWLEGRRSGEGGQVSRSPFLHLNYKWDPAHSSIPTRKRLYQPLCAPCRLHYRHRLSELTYQRRS